MPLNKDIKKVLMIGSGPIVIGQAAEFDYAGAQACRVLKAAGVNVENVIGSDLYLYNRTPGSIWGADDAFFSAPRIDNLMCFWCCVCQITHFLFIKRKN